MTVEKSYLSHQVDDRVATITLNRPDKRNALNLAMLEQLREILSTVVGSDARVLLLRGEGSVFCAGADLSGVREDDFHDALNAVLRGFAEVPVPVVVHAHGAALGAGVQLLAVSDLRVLAPGCTVGVPAARLGLVVHHWTVRRLMSEFTPSVARAMLLAAENYDAEHLHAIGAVHRVGDLASAIAWAKELALHAPLSARGHKIALESGELTDLVAEARATALTSADAREGREAFVEKRAPRFVGQ